MNIVGAVAPVRMRLVVAVCGALAALALAAPAAGAATCPARPLAQTFLPWVDLAYYQAVPDSGFEEGTSWALSGGATVVEGNQPFLEGAKSLDLPAGSLAITAPICVTAAHPTIRFFARNTGSALAPLTVSVQFGTLLGNVELSVGAVLGGSEWAPTLPLPLLGNLLSNEVRVRFHPEAGSAWQIDDVYVDPYSKG